MDSATVLGYLTSTEGEFRPYEGVRVAETQAASLPEEGGILTGWGWIPGKENPADVGTGPDHISIKDVQPESI